MTRIFFALVVLGGLLTAGCGSSDPPAEVGEIKTSPQGAKDMQSGKPMKGAARPSLD